MSIVNVHGYKFSKDEVQTTKSGKWVKAVYNKKYIFLKKYDSIEYPAAGLLSDREQLDKKKRLDALIIDKTAVLTTLYHLKKQLPEFNIAMPMHFFFEGASLYQSTAWCDTSCNSVDEICLKPPILKCDLLLKISNLITKLHSGCIVHGDIKPENLIIKLRNNDIELCLIDFDHTFFCDTTLTGKEITDDFRYIAPELYDCKTEKTAAVKLGFSADIFSLGVLFFQLWTGKMPFEHQNELACCAIKNGTVLKDDSLPSRLNQIINQMLCEAANMRPSIFEVTEKLKNFKASLEAQSATENQPVKQLSANISELRTLLLAYKQLIRSDYTNESLALLDETVSQLSAAIKSNDISLILQFTGEFKTAFNALVKHETLDFSQCAKLCTQIIGYLKDRGDSKLLLEANNKLVTIFSKCKTENVSQELIDYCCKEAIELFNEIKHTM